MGASLNGEFGAKDGVDMSFDGVFGAFDGTGMDTFGACDGTCDVGPGTSSISTPTVQRFILLSKKSTRK